LAELHDKQLFEQPDSSYLGECPICCLPLSLDKRKNVFMGCCSKRICKGCDYANQMREIEAGLEQRCAFCRNPSPESQEEAHKNTIERVKKNDPVAMAHMGKKHKVEGDFGKALEYWTKAAELGDADASCGLGALYYYGNGVEKDLKKGVYHLEQAAIGGHPNARGLLATHEMDNFRLDRAAKHLIIAANLGCDLSLKLIKDFYVRGVVSREEHDTALRGHQAAVDATTSAERDEAEAFKTMQRGVP
jgi:TPR repeat protein